MRGGSPREQGGGEGVKPRGRESEREKAMGGGQEGKRRDRRKKRGGADPIDGRGRSKTQAPIT